MPTHRLFNRLAQPAKHPATLGRIFADALGVRDRLTHDLSNIARIQERAFTLTAGVTCTLGAVWAYTADPAPDSVVYLLLAGVMILTKVSAVGLGHLADMSIRPQDYPDNTPF
jgi:hypothetical protein